MHNNNWGTTLIGAILLLLLAGGLYTMHSWSEWNRRQEQERREKLDLERRAENDRKLRAFTEGNPDLKPMQELIDELDQEIQVREKKLSQLAVEMLQFGRAPESDPDYTRWKQAISELRKKLRALQTEREETYLEWKKVENNPEQKVDLTKARDERVQKARVLAEETRRQFNDLRNHNKPDELTSTPASEKKDEKKNEKTPPKKKWWFF